MISSNHKILIEFKLLNFIIFFLINFFFQVKKRNDLYLVLRSRVLPCLEHWRWVPLRRLTERLSRRWSTRKRTLAGPASLASNRLHFLLLSSLQLGLKQPTLPTINQWSINGHQLVTPPPHRRNPIGKRNQRAAFNRITTTKSAIDLYSISVFF